MELQEQDRGRFCSCCGRKNEYIWDKLQEQKSIPKPGTIGVSKQEWKEHTVYKDSDYFYDNNFLEYCEECGEKLMDEDVKTVRESRGECHGTPCSETIVVGYECSSCGHKEDN